VSVITNFAEGLSAQPLSHEQTLRDAEGAAGDLTRLVLGLLERIGADAHR
jgi:purine nucleoside phosphorylase